MEFDEMKKIWDAQNNAPIFVLDEQALHNRVIAKKAQAKHITRFTEIFAILANIAGGAAVAFTWSGEKTGTWMKVMAGWMFATAFYVIINRIRRLRSGHSFDRSIAGDLDQAIATATYQVRFSNVMRWNSFPIVVLMIGWFWESGLSYWFMGGLIVFFSVMFYAGGFEHRFYERRKHELEILRGKLV
jgi:hypothetical protein